MSRESADNYSNERSLPIDLVRDGRIPPVARSTASRKPNPSTSAQCVETQIAEARGRRQHRSIAVCRIPSHLPQGTRRAQNPQARDRPALALRGFWAYWRWKSRSCVGRSKTPVDTRQLIREISVATRGEE